MFEKLFFAVLFTGWLGSFVVLAIYEPEKVILFARIFRAVCIGMARQIGVA